MKSSNITIKDMAKRLNVSVSTVSRALRDMHDINPETKRRVLELAQNLDYQPNQVALSLVKSSTKTLGVVVPRIGYSFFSSVLQGIESEANQAGYNLILCQSSEDFEKEKDNIQNLLRSQVEGFIISLADTPHNHEHIQKLIKRDIPLVMFDRFSDAIECNKVIIDNKLAAKQAIQHLISNGCKRIGMMAGPPHLHISNERIKGYKEALAEANIEYNPAHVLHCDFSLENVAENISAYWSDFDDKPDGIFAVSDRIAITAIHTLKKMGVEVPKEVAIIGFNDDPFSSMFTPTLSSVAQPTFEMGEEVVKLLLEQINRSPQAPVSYTTKVLPTRLVIRESSIKK